MASKYKFVGIKLPPELLRELHKHRSENLSATIRALLREALDARKQAEIDPPRPLVRDFGSHR